MNLGDEEKLIDKFLKEANIKNYGYKNQKLVRLGVKTWLEDHNWNYTKALEAWNKKNKR